MTHAIANLESYYAAVQEKGSMLSQKLAHNWSEATLKMMGLYMQKSGKKALSEKLPEPLSDQLGRVFRLMHFPDPNMSLDEFLHAVARRAGHSDPQYAEMGVKAVFYALKTIIDKDTSDKVADSLSPEVRALWQNA